MKVENVLYVWRVDGDCAYVTEIDRRSAEALSGMLKQIKKSEERINYATLLRGDMRQHVAFALLDVLRNDYQQRMPETSDGCVSGNSSECKAGDIFEIGSVKFEQARAPLKGIDMTY